MGTDVPWYSLLPGQEPDWPRPLAHWSLEELAALGLKEIRDYCDAYERGEEPPPNPSHAEVWLRGEAWHEYRWRRYRIVRRHFGTLAPPNGETYAEEVRLALRDLDWDELGVDELSEARTPPKSSTPWR